MENNVQNYNEYSMKWHKFLVNFALWLSAAMMVVTGFQALTGAHYGDAKDAVYLMYGSMKTLDMIYGLICIAIAAFTIYARFQLARFKMGAPGKLYIMYALNVIIPLIYLALTSAVTGISFGELTDSNFISSLAGGVIGIAINRTYYGKRASLFVE